MTGRSSSLCVPTSTTLTKGVSGARRVIVTRNTTNGGCKALNGIGNTEVSLQGSRVTSLVSRKIVPVMRRSNHAVTFSGHSLCGKTALNLRRCPVIHMFS